MGNEMQLSGINSGEGRGSLESLNSTEKNEQIIDGSPKAEKTKKSFKVPSWIVGVGKTFANVARAVGFVVFGALTLGTFPVILLGLELGSAGVEKLKTDENSRAGKVLKSIGLILVSPALIAAWMIEPAIT